MDKVNQTRDPAIKLSDIQFSFASKASNFGLKLDSLEISKGESVFLAGQSGSGKSTLMGLICGTLIPQSGEVSILGTPTTPLSQSARDQIRADHIGIIFQTFNLLPYLSIMENVLLPLHFSNTRKIAATKNMQTGTADAQRLLTALGVHSEQFRNQKTANLSVGQQQRVAAARAFIGSPEIIIADEPTSALDEGRQIKFMELLFAEKERTGACLIMVSHDMRLAKLFDRVIQIQDLCKTSPETLVA